MTSPYLLLLLPLLASPAAGSFLYRPSEATSTPEGNQLAAIVLVPTPPPVMLVHRRDDEEDHDDEPTFTRGVQTCGYEGGLTESAYRCVDETRSCTNDGTYIGCCDFDSTCLGSFPTACIDLVGSEAGECELDGGRTRCCSDTTAPSCRTLFMSSTLTAFGCGVSSGSATLFGIPSNHEGQFTSDGDNTDGATNVDIETVRTTSTTMSTFKTPDVPLDVPPEEEPRPTTGAIVGGVVGAVVVFAAVIIGAVVYVHRKNAKDEAELSPTAPTPFYCVPEAAQTPQGSGSDLGGTYPHNAHYYPYPRSSNPSISDGPDRPECLGEGSGTNRTQPNNT